MHVKKTNSSQESLYGSARFATWKDIQRSGLAANEGLYQGEFDDNGKTITLLSPANSLIFAAETGERKLDLIVEQLLTSRESIYVSDRLARYSAITIGNQAALNKKAYCFFDDESRLNRAPWFLIAEKINPLSVLIPDHPELKKRALRVAGILINPGRELTSVQIKDDLEKARSWFADLMCWLIKSNNRIIDLPEVYDLIRLIEGNPPQWDRILEQQMVSGGNPQFRQLAQDMRITRARQPNNYIRVIAFLHSSLEYLEQASLRTKLSREGRKLEEIIGEGFTFYNCSKLNELQSLFAITLMMAKQDQLGDGGTLLVMLDERARLGQLEQADGSYIDDQNNNIVIEEFWSSLSEMRKLLGESGMHDRLSRFSVQHYHTMDTYSAGLVSRMLGTATIKYKSSRAKMQDDQLNASIALAVLKGKDPLEEVVRANAQKDTYDVQARALKKPEELENMPLDRKIMLFKHIDCPPIEGRWKSYKSKTYLHGLYLPDPRYPPYNQIVVSGKRGRELTRRLIITDIPASLRNFPQYANGLRAVVEPSEKLFKNIQKIWKKPHFSDLGN